MSIPAPTPVDPDLTLGVPATAVSVVIDNAILTQEDILRKALSVYDEVRSCYTFELPKSGRQLACGFRFSTAKNTPTMTYLLYHDGTADGGHQQVFKRFSIPVLPFVRQGPKGDTILSLRTRRDTDDLVSEVVELAKTGDGELRSAAAGLGLKPGAAEGCALRVTKTRQTRAEIAQREREEQQELYRKQLVEAQQAERDRLLALRRRAPSYAPLPDDVSGAGGQMEVYFGADETMLSAQLAEDHEVPDDELAGAAAAGAGTGAGADGGLLAESLGSPSTVDPEGAQAYAADKVHEQLWHFNQLVSQHFGAMVVTDGGALGVSRVGVAGNRRTRYNITPVLFALSDVKDQFEHDYDRVKKEGVICQCYPLCAPREGEELWLQNWLSGEIFPIENPSNFSLLAHVASRDGGPFTLHKTRPMFNESSEVTLRNVESANRSFVDSVSARRLTSRPAVLAASPAPAAALALGKGTGAPKPPGPKPPVPPPPSTSSSSSASSSGATTSRQAQVQALAKHQQQQHGSSHALPTSLPVVVPAASSNSSLDALRSSISKAQALKAGRSAPSHAEEEAEDAGSDGEEQTSAGDEDFQDESTLAVSGDEDDEDDDRSNLF